MFLVQPRIRGSLRNENNENYVELVYLIINIFPTNLSTMLANRHERHWDRLLSLLKGSCQYGLRLSINSRLPYTSHLYLSIIEMKQNSLLDLLPADQFQGKIMKNLPSKPSFKLHSLVPDNILAASNNVNNVFKSQ